MKKETITFDNGKYVGEVKEGKPHGKGTLTYLGGTKMKGEWKNGFLNGKGTTVLYDNGVHITSYSGQFKDNKYHGKGTLTYPEKKNILVNLKMDQDTEKGQKHILMVVNMLESIRMLKQMDLEL